MKSALLLLALCGFAVCLTTADNLEGTAEVNHVCPEVMCMMHCEHGYEKDANDCNTCECKPEPQHSVTTAKCPSFMCYMRCQYGFQKDSSGCDVCKCNPKPQCPEVMCLMACENGYQKDANGCDTCKCNRSPGLECPEVMCADRCHYGYKKNERGCNTCECKEAPVAKPTCSRVMCRMYCRYGWQKDENGCDKCLCNEKPVETTPKPCSRAMCMMYCPHGFEKDANNCNMCKCQKPGLIPATTKPKCRPVLCRMFCEYGWQKDESGCEICRCNRKPTVTVKPECQPVLCKMLCEYGWQKDKNGCEICRCNRKPTITHVTTKPCSKAMCMMHCPLGFEKDVNGCDTCKCKKAPHHIECPMMKCVPCKSGLYKYDVNGCRTCECEEPGCNMMDCPDGMICNHHNAERKAVCKPMPICHRRRALELARITSKDHLWPMMLLGKPEAVPYRIPPVLKCDKDGNFAPQQCNHTECWCVDDRGVAIHGTRKEQSKEFNCEHKKTQVLSVGFNMTHDLIDLDQHMTEFRRTLQHKLSGWTSVQEKFIKDILVKPHTSTIVFVEFDLHYDGYTDLASTAVHLNFQIIKRYFVIHYQSTTFRPVPETVKMNHFYTPKTICTLPWRHQAREWTEHNLPIVVGGSVVLILTIAVIVTAVMLIRKKRIQEKQSADNGPNYKQIMRVSV